MTLHIDQQDTLARDGDDTLFRFDPNKHEVYRHGQQVTTEAVKAIVETVERSSPPAGLIPGGKSLSGGSTHSPRLYLVVSNDTKERIIEAAADDGMSVSRWLRRTVEEKLAA